MSLSLSVALPAALSEMRAQGILGVGRLRSGLTATTMGVLFVVAMLAAARAVDGLSALQLAMISVGVWVLLVANGLSGAYLGGTGTRDLHGVVDHLPIGRRETLLLPFALGLLRTGTLSALLCGVAIVAPRTAASPTPVWLSLLVAASLPVLPATLVWATTRVQRPYAATWILIPVSMLFSVPVVDHISLTGPAAVIAEIVGLPARAVLGTADPRHAGALLFAGVLAVLALRLRPQPLSDDSEVLRPRLASLPMHSSRPIGRLRLAAELVVSVTVWGRVAMSIACLLGLVVVAMVGTPADDTSLVHTLVVLGLPSLVTVVATVSLGLTPAALLDWSGALPLSSADLRRGNALVIGLLGALTVALAATAAVSVSSLALTAGLCAFALPLGFALWAEAARHHLRGAARVVIPSVTSPWLGVRPILGTALVTTLGLPGFGVLACADLALAALAWRLLDVRPLVPGGSR